MLLLLLSLRHVKTSFPKKFPKSIKTIKGLSPIRVDVCGRENQPAQRWRPNICSFQRLVQAWTQFQILLFCSFCKRSWSFATYRLCFKPPRWPKPETCSVLFAAWCVFFHGWATHTCSCSHEVHRMVETLFLFLTKCPSAALLRWTVDAWGG